MKFTYILILGLFASIVWGNCQIVDLRNDKYWIDVGVGSYQTTISTEGFLFTLSANVISDSTLYKLQVVNYQEFMLFGPDPAEEFYSAGMMIGKGVCEKYFQVQISGGLGFMAGVKRGKLLYTEPSQGWFSLSDPRHFEKKQFITPSIPVELELIVKPVKYMGVGVSLFGNLNFVRPVYGFIFKFNIGKMR